MRKPRKASAGAKAGKTAAHHHGRHHHRGAGHHAPPHPAGKPVMVVRHLPAKKPKAPKKRQWSPGYDLACCSAEAVAMCLRLATGLAVPVTEDDVLALYFATAGDPDDGAAIEDTLEAAARLGVAGAFLPQFAERGVHLAGQAAVPADVQHVGVPAAGIAARHAGREPLAAVTAGRLACESVPGADGVLEEPVVPISECGHGLILGIDALDAVALCRVSGCSLARAYPAAAGECTTALYPWTGNAAPNLILGLDLPEGPHAVLATPGGWWSWGELYDPSEFPGAVIEEAWEVRWTA